MRHLVAPTLALFLLAPLSSAALEPDMHPGELAHALDRLASTTRVLYVAAHPDDENTRLLAWLANQRHVRAAYLSMTRGGGGQNLIGSEQGELLDAIRTEELLAARRLDGAEQRFTNVRDFGYSKSADETLGIWGKEAALSDVVRVIRSFQPDVIVTRFDENPPNHGHHTASAILAREAFTAAADPARFPDQKLPAWQASRLLYNVAPWNNVVPEGSLEVDVGGFDPRLGLGYAELAALSRSQHKSQGFGVAGERGRLIERFVTVAGSAPKADLLDDVAATWEARFGAAGAEVDRALADARRTLDRDRPEAALPHLLRARGALAALPASIRKADASAALDEMIVASAGIWLRATSPRPSATPGDEIDVELEVLARRPVDAEVTRIEFPGGEAAGGEALGLEEKKLYRRKVRIAADAKPGAPYWLAQAPTAGRFQTEDPTIAGAPRGPAALKVIVDLSIAGEKVRATAPLVHAWTDRVHGERIRPFLVVPPATVTPTREAVMIPDGGKGPVALRIRAGRDGVKGKVRLPVPAGWKVEPASQEVSLARAGDEATVRFDVQAPRSAASIRVRPEVEVAGKTWSWREDVIDYPHIPVQAVLQPASLRLSPLQVELPKGRIGYLQGSGDSIAEDLAHVGVQVEAIDDEQLRTGDLDRFAAIVVGIRAYNTRPAVIANHDRLMRYAEGGGVVVVQYVTVSRWQPLDVPVGPFPLEIGPGRITDETAEMIPLDENEPLLHTPNRLTAADFDGWVQERGLYFASKWDPRFRPLFRAKDPGEDPQDGGTLIADLGKGRYVYTGLAFFRQLRAGVPGAYRLFSNLVSKP